MRTKTCVWLALCTTTALSVGLMVLAIFFYEYNIDDDSSINKPDESFKILKISKASYMLFYSLEHENKELQDSWMSFKDKYQSFINARGTYIGKIECSVFTSVCHEFGVERYPTIVWIDHGQVTDEYVGDNKIESFKAFFDEHTFLIKNKTNTSVVVNSTTISGNITEEMPVSVSVLPTKSENINKEFIEHEKIVPVSKVTKLNTTENIKNVTTASENKKESSTAPEKSDLVTESVKVDDTTKDEDDVLETTIEIVTEVNGPEETTKSSIEPIKTAKTSEVTEKKTTSLPTTKRSIETTSVNPTKANKKSKKESEAKIQKDTTEPIIIKKKASKKSEEKLAKKKKNSSDEKPAKKEKPKVSAERTISKTPNAKSTSTTTKTPETNVSSEYEGILMAMPASSEETANEETRQQKHDDSRETDKAIDLAGLFGKTSDGKDEKEYTDGDYEEDYEYDYDDEESPEEVAVAPEKIDEKSKEVEEKKKSKKLSKQTKE